MERIRNQGISRAVGYEHNRNGIEMTFPEGWDVHPSFVDDLYQYLTQMKKHCESDGIFKSFAYERDEMQGPSWNPRIHNHASHLPERCVIELPSTARMLPAMIPQNFGECVLIFEIKPRKSTLGERNESFSHHRQFRQEDDDQEEPSFETFLLRQLELLNRFGMERHTLGRKPPPPPSSSRGNLNESFVGVQPFQGILSKSPKGTCDKIFWSGSLYDGSISVLRSSKKILQRKTPTRARGDTMGASDGEHTFFLRIHSIPNPKHREELIRQVFYGGGGADDADGQFAVRKKGVPAPLPKKMKVSEFCKTPEYRYLLHCAKRNAQKLAFDVAQKMGVDIPSVADMSGPYHAHMAPRLIGKPSLYNCVSVVSCNGFRAKICNGVVDKAHSDGGFTFSSNPAYKGWVVQGADTSRTLGTFCPLPYGKSTTIKKMQPLDASRNSSFGTDNKERNNELQACFQRVCYPEKPKNSSLIREAEGLTLCRRIILKNEHFDGLKCLFGPRSLLTTQSNVSTHNAMYSNHLDDVGAQPWSSPTSPSSLLKCDTVRTLITFVTKLNA